MKLWEKKGLNSDSNILKLLNIKKIMTYGSDLEQAQKHGRVKWVNAWDSNRHLMLIRSPVSIQI